MFGFQVKLHNLVNRSSEAKNNVLVGRYIGQGWQVLIQDL